VTARNGLGRVAPEAEDETPRPAVTGTARASRVDAGAWHCGAEHEPALDELAVEV